MDPDFHPESKITNDLAERVEKSVGPDNIAERIRELSNIMPREEVAFKISEEIVEGSFNKEFNQIHRKRFNLHNLEEKLMVSPFKKLMLSFFELKIFRHFLKSINFNLTGKRILEVGCGAGYGIEQIYESFKPKEYFAFDLDPKMVSLSLAKVKKKNLLT